MSPHDDSAPATGTTCGVAVAGDDVDVVVVVVVDELVASAVIVDEAETGAPGEVGADRVVEGPDESVAAIGVGADDVVTVPFELVRVGSGESARSTVVSAHEQAAAATSSASSARRTDRTRWALVTRTV